MGNIGAQFVELFTANKWLRWSVFWLGWFWLSPTTIIPGAIAVGVGNVFYRERAVNIYSIAAAYLGILGYLLLGHMINDWPEQVRLSMGLGGIASLRFPAKAGSHNRGSVNMGPTCAATGAGATAGAQNSAPRDSPTVP